MKKSKILISLFIISIISLIYPSIKSSASNRTDLTGRFKDYITVSENDLYDTRELMCIHRGYNSAGTFKKVQTIQITNGQVNNRSQAIMALISAYSNGLKNDNAGTNYRLKPGGLYWNSYSQNAIWKYWKTFYNSSGFTINKAFSKTSNPYNSNTAKKLIERGTEYYRSLNGDNIKLKTKKQKTETWGYKQVSDGGEDCHKDGRELNCNSAHHSKALRMLLLGF